jgi:nitrate/nitrite transporter NarK
LGAFIPFSTVSGKGVEHQYGWSKAEIQVAFTIFILCETWLVPFEGYIVDRIGPKFMVATGDIATFLAWAIVAARQPGVVQT